MVNLKKCESHSRSLNYMYLVAHQRSATNHPSQFVRLGVGQWRWHTGPEKRRGNRLGQASSDMMEPCEPHDVTMTLTIKGSETEKRHPCEQRVQMISENLDSGVSTALTRQHARRRDETSTVFWEQIITQARTESFELYSTNLTFNERQYVLRLKFFFKKKKNLNVFIV